MGVQRFNRPEGARYCVARRAGADCVVYEEPDYLTEFAAYVAAAKVATALGARLAVPVAMTGDLRARLVAFWSRHGRMLFLSDQPRALCCNRHERIAYDAAEAAL